MDGLESNAFALDALRGLRVSGESMSRIVPGEIGKGARHPVQSCLLFHRDLGAVMLQLDDPVCEGFQDRLGNATKDVPGEETGEARLILHRRRSGGFVHRGKRSLGNGVDTRVLEYLAHPRGYLWGVVLHFVVRQECVGQPAVLVKLGDWLLAVPIDLVLDDDEPDLVKDPGTFVQRGEALLLQPVDLKSDALELESGLLDLEPGRLSLNLERALPFCLPLCLPFGLLFELLFIGLASISVLGLARHHTVLYANPRPNPAPGYPTPTCGSPQVPATGRRYPCGSLYHHVTL